VNKPANLHAARLRATSENAQLLPDTAIQRAFSGKNRRNPGQHLDISQVIAYLARRTLTTRRVDQSSN
jgi:hypothetical protein